MKKTLVIQWRRFWYRQKNEKLQIDTEIRDYRISVPKDYPWTKLVVEDHIEFSGRRLEVRLPGRGGLIAEYYNPSFRDIVEFVVDLWERAGAEV